VNRAALMFLLNFAGITDRMRTFGRALESPLVGLLLALLAGGLLAGVAFAGRTSAARGATARSANAGIVVVETNLGYQGGAAAGTGMVLTSSGEVLTNNHVIEGATSIRVVVPQTGRSYKAVVVGYDVAADTAVLQLQGAAGLATVTTGDSSTLRLGQAVRAVGNAGGTGRLATARGNVTGLGRTITASNDQGRSEQLKGLIETDAALQPGDSGGPLLDASGRVVGMDAAASTAADGFYFQAAANDAYAIPVNHALALARQIEAGRSSATVHVGDTAFLGIEAASGSGYGYGYGSSTRGAVVAAVLSGSPADRAGLSRGDQIMALDGRAIASPDALVELLLRRKPGSTISLTWLDVFGGRRQASLVLASGPPQ
jgi:S1-C subfamily serine protease